MGLYWRRKLKIDCESMLNISASRRRVRDGLVFCAVAQGALRELLVRTFGTDDARALALGRIAGVSAQFAGVKT